ncbi:hypothetical protein AAG906_013740 [Vitis piasezkii]
MGSDVVFISACFILRGGLFMCRTDSVVFGLPGSFMDPHRFARSLSLTGCSLRRGHDRYLTEPPRSIQLGLHFSTLGCHHASPSGRCILDISRSALLDAWMSSCFLPRDASLICRFDSVAGMDDSSSSDFSRQILLSDTVAVLGRSYVECLDPHVTISVGPVIAFVTQPRDIVFASLTIIPELFIEISSQWSVDRDS